MPRLIIDNFEVEVPPGTKVIDAAERLGIMIPRFCYHEALGAVGACRMCAVKFIQGPFKGVQMSCMIDAQDGMVVSTTDEEAVAFRKQVIEWLMLNHPHDCPVCDEGGQCLLQDETVSGGHGIRRYWGKKRTYRDQYLGHFIAHEMNRCIHCYRCSRFYQIFSGYRDLGVMQLGDRTFFGRYTNGHLESPFSGNLVDICPTGVYTDKTARFKVRRWDLQRSRSVCIHCSLGCNTVGNAHYRGVMRIEARFNDLVNGYFMCDLGRFAFSYANGGADHTGRPWHPRIGSEETGYSEAMEAAVSMLSKVNEKTGSRAIAALGSPRNSLETQSMLHRLCKLSGWQGPEFFIAPALKKKVKTAVSRLDESLAVSLREIEKADFILAMGVDPINEAPMLAYSMRQAYRSGAPVVVIDPRPISLPMEFDHLPVAPQSIDLCIAMIIRASLESQDTGGQKAIVPDFYKGLPSEFPFDPKTNDRLSILAQKLGKSRKPVIVCGTDVVRESTPSLAADHATILGSFREKAGLFYVLPGPNAFGAAVVGSSVETDFLDLLEAIEQGSIKALLIIENDPFRYFPDRQRLELAIRKLDVLVVLDYLPTESVRLADVFIPTSTVFETGASFVNQEGRLQFAERVHHGGIPIWGERPPRTFRDDIPGGEHRAAWKVIADIAHALQLPADQIPVADPVAFVADEIVPFARIGSSPYPSDGIRLIPGKSPHAPFSSEFSLKGRSSSGDVLEMVFCEWLFGTEELSSYSDTIYPVVKEPYGLMHPDDAARAGLSDGEKMSIHLDEGALQVKLKVTAKVAAGIVILPRHMHLAWQRMSDFSALVPFDRIEKARE